MRERIRNTAAASVLGLLIVSVVLGAEPQPCRKQPAQYEVATALYDWHDHERDREVPAKIYCPESGAGPFPVIIFSHGLGGSREGYEYLGRHWASHGYVSVHLQHIRSDAGVWRDSRQGNVMQNMRRAAADPRNAIDRPLDVTFALDEVTRMNKGESPWKGRLDPERAGIAGHSFGAYTTLASSGMLLGAASGKGKSLGDPRIKAAIPMSSPVPQKKVDFDRLYSAIKIPCLHMTGTKDVSPINDTTAEQRRIPFDHMSGGDQYLVVFKDGDHMIFSGHKRLRGGGGKDPIFHDLICQSTTAFWDAYLKDDPGAKAWLADGGFDRVLSSVGTLEKKLAVPRTDR